MKKHKRAILSGVLVALFVTIFSLSTAAPAFADATECRCTNTYSDGTVKKELGVDASIFGDENGCLCGGAQNALQIVTDIFTGTLVVAGTFGLVWVGIMFLKARDDEILLIRAKRRLAQVIVGIVAFTLIDVLTNLFIPQMGGGRIVSTSSKRVEVDEDYMSSSTENKPKYTPEDEEEEVQPEPKQTKHTYKKTVDLAKKSDSTCKDGAKQINKAKYYRQFKLPWADKLWKGGTCKGSSKNWKPNAKIGASACPMIASLNAINHVTGCDYTPEMFAEKMRQHTNNFTKMKGLFTHVSWKTHKVNKNCWYNTSFQIVEYYARAYNVNYKHISKSKVKDALMKGHAVVVNGKGGKVFGTSGHFVMLSAYDPETELYTVVNPSGYKLKDLKVKVPYSKALKKTTYHIEIWPKKSKK